MIDTIVTLAAFAFALGVIIFVHEAGHLLVAKAFGVRVLTFSLGFGKRLFGVRRGETDYRVSLIPLGGYVKLGGEIPDEASGDPREFLSKPRWQRVLVYLAGPAMNVLLAIFLFAGLFMVGIEVPHLPDVPPVVGVVQEGSSGARAGLQRGDRILAVNGNRAESWLDVASELAYSPDRPVRLRVERGQRTFTAVVTPKGDPREGIGADFAGLYPIVRPEITAIDPGSPAEKARLQVGDELLGVDGVPVANSEQFVAYIQKSPGRRLLLEVSREGRRLVVPVVPRADGKIGKLGVYLGYFQRYGPLRAFGESIEYNLQLTRETFRVLGKIVRRELSAKGALSGPIEIAARTGEAARRGFRELIHLMGFISLSIAILNLMPIPILDGGQIAVLLVESAMRRDLSLRIKEAIAQVGFVLILILMVTVLYFDIVKRLPGLF
ncbi:MAG TPA: RIP metalloprotease RseP [Thermoanaerobaculia bacterium]|nr:RIP metalloprotease RseP [Thermoanaerobaculia bacterium]